jgi:oxygen-independent coproporphyrinogen-3 oxidase
MTMRDPLEGINLQEIAGKLGFTVHLPILFAPPNIYPMSAPKFVSSPRAGRTRPAGTRLGIYVHVPFCNYACNFCFYAKRVGDEESTMARYVRALTRELEWVESGTELAELYVGGGTPTALPAPLLDELLASVFARMRDRPGAIHTVECSPESISPEHVRVLCDRKIRRVSLGIQSLRDDVLNKVRRHHDREQSLAACRRLVESDRIVNVDLIYGLPAQTEESLIEDFRAIAALGVHSVTIYNLRVNDRTPVANALREEERLDLVRLARWRAIVKRIADELGFVQTRWHAFRRATLQLDGAGSEGIGVPGLSGEQLGIGLSARSRLGRTIYRNHPDLGAYLARVEAGCSPVEEVFTLSDEDRKLRYVAASLGDGVPLDRAGYRRSFGCSVEADFGEVLRKLVDVGLIADNGEQIRVTDAGALVYDLVMLAFYPQAVREWLGSRQQAALAKRREAQR